MLCVLLLSILFSSCRREDTVIQYTFNGMGDLSYYDVMITYSAGTERISEIITESHWKSGQFKISFPVSDKIEWKLTPKDNYPHKDVYSVYFYIIVGCSRISGNGLHNTGAAFVESASDCKIVHDGTLEVIEGELPYNFK